MRALPVVFGIFPGIFFVPGTVLFPILPPGLDPIKTRRKSLILLLKAASGQATTLKVKEISGKGVE